MTMAQIGFFTAAMEGLAAAVGAGMLLGGFAAGSVGSIAGCPRPSLDRWVLATGYFGGAVGVVLAITDLLLRYGG